MAASELVKRRRTAGVDRQIARLERERLLAQLALTVARGRARTLIRKKLAQIRRDLVQARRRRRTNSA